MKLVKALEHQPTRYDPTLLAGFADGSLGRRERAAASAHLRHSPDARRQLERQCRVATALRSGGPQLSPAVRERLASEQRWSARPGRGVSGLPRGAQRWVPISAPALTLALVAGLAVWWLAKLPAPTVAPIDRTSELAFLAGTAPPPPADRADPSELEARVGGVNFPDYRRDFGGLASGQRWDVIAGRNVRTVYYELRGGERLSYSIVSGSPLTPPAAARRVIVAGVPLRAYREHGLSVVTLVRSGRTCVLAGTMPASTVLSLAEAPLRHESPS